MISPVSRDFLTYYDWFHAVLSTEDQPLILYRTSALECLELFPGYGGETEIDVYATRKGKYENVTYHIIPNLSDVDTVNYYALRCTSLSQTVNDMLDEYETMDEQALVESLAMYYCRKKGSFDGIFIKPEHTKKFDIIKQYASEHFGG